jgi:hypothetical protein
MENEFELFENNPRLLDLAVSISVLNAKIDSLTDCFFGYVRMTESVDKADGYQTDFEAFLDERLRHVKKLLPESDSLNSSLDKILMRKRSL